MFEPGKQGRVFALPPGADFPRGLVDGLCDRMDQNQPDDMARVQLIVNTRRMARRIRDLFDQGPAMFLPRIALISDLESGLNQSPAPAARSSLRRRLELVQLIGRLLDQQPDLAARASAFDLADSLAALMDEMQGEGVSADTIRGLDISDMSGHWARAQTFFGIAESYLAGSDASPDSEARHRKTVESLIAQWAEAPPDHPVIIAGSTGSRGTTLMLMEAVAKLPRGCVILPGFDFDQPAAIWDQLTTSLLSEDHPQFRFRKLLDRLDLTPPDVVPWTDPAGPVPERNKLVSLALRPAPFTDAWLSEGPGLPDLQTALADVTLVEAPSPRAEALTIALRLRQATEDGETAALITPDRMLTRQVAAALDRWNIVPDDSAGLPLHLSPPGRFLRHVAGLFSQRLNNEILLTLLKHPLCHGGDGRGDHLLHTRDLELLLRRKGPPFPDQPSLAGHGETAKPPGNWITWVTQCFSQQDVSGPLPLSEWVTKLMTLAQQLSAGSNPIQDGPLWDKNAGQSALETVSNLTKEAEAGGSMTAREFSDLLGGLLSQEVVRDRDVPDSTIMIWGTLEARVQGADLLILGGLNEGSWPEPARPDPWLNRTLRAQAGLLLPERRIGLSAHDFQQAVCAPKVWMTRSHRSDEAETIASRWLNRLTNLLGGLPDQNGPSVLHDMRARGDRWLHWAKALDASDRTAPAIRPSPRPPLVARPRSLSVTEIKRLIRDPYSIYARHVLRLKPLDPLIKAPDALLRGIVVHEILEKFVTGTRDGTCQLSRSALMETAAEVLENQVPWPTAQRLWLARINHVADWFVSREKARQANAEPLKFEARVEIRLDDLDFALKGFADRIDRDQSGALHIYDYKTGAPPTPGQQAQFDKQLLLEAAAAEQGGFKDIDPAPVASAVFIGLGRVFKEVPAPLVKEPPEKVWAELKELISAYLELDQGYTSRRMLHKDTEVGDYDHLARFGEWDRASDPVPEDLT